MRTEIESIKKELGRLVKEMEEIKGRVLGEGRKLELVTVEDITGELRREPKSVVAIGNLMREMTGKVDEGGALIHAGYLVKGGKRVGNWVNTLSIDKWIDGPLKLSPKEIARFLSPFSSEQRLIILRSLHEGFLQGKTVSELVEETGFEGGQLYHHLRELERADYVETKKERGRYFISVMGHIALLTVSHMAAVLPSFVEKKLGEVEPNPS